MEIRSQKYSQSKQITAPELRAALESLGKWNDFLEISKNKNDSIRVNWEKDGFRVSYREGELQATYKSKSFVTFDSSLDILRSFVAGNGSWKFVTDWEAVDINLTSFKSYFPSLVRGLLVVIGLVIMFSQSKAVDQFLFQFDLSIGHLLIAIIVIPFGWAILKSTYLELKITTNSQHSNKERLKAAGGLLWTLLWLTLMTYFIWSNARSTQSHNMRPSVRMLLVEY